MIWAKQRETLIDANLRLLIYNKNIGDTLQHIVLYINFFCTTYGPIVSKQAQHSKCLTAQNTTFLSQLWLSGISRSIHSAQMSQSGQPLIRRYYASDKRC